MSQIFFTKSKQRPSAFATLGLVVAFLAFVTLLGAGPVLGYFQPTSPVAEELFAWRLKLLDLSNYLLLGGSALTLIGIIQGRFSTRVRTSWRGFVAALLCLLVAIPLWYKNYLESNHPAIHDVSTNISDPPYFRDLAERSYENDALAGSRLDLTYQQLHEQAHSDLKPLELNIPPTAALAAARRATERLQWTIESQNTVEGQIEAYYQLPLLGLQSNIAIRVRPVDAGERSLLDIRAVSQLGVMDYGINERLINAFLEAVKADIG